MLLPRGDILSDVGIGVANACDAGNETGTIGGPMIEKITLGHIRRVIHCGRRKFPIGAQFPKSVALTNHVDLDEQAVRHGA